MCCVTKPEIARSVNFCTTNATKCRNEGIIFYCVIFKVDLSDSENDFDGEGLETTEEGGGKIDSTTGALASSR